MEKEPKLMKQANFIDHWVEEGALARPPQDCPLRQGL